MNIKEIILNEEKRTISFLFISLICLILSFIKINVYGFDLSWIAILFCALPIFKEAAIGLLTEFDIKADVLVSIAIISSIIIGELFAAGVIAWIMALGGFLEEYTVAKTRSGIEKLVDLSPSQGTLIINYNAGNMEEKIIDAKLIEIGNILKVLPGETIPVDGEIISGESSIDQSIMTGESIPLDKFIGDEVFSGTINLYGSFFMKATKKGEDSSLQKLITLVESANPESAKIVKLADKWATWIVIIAFISAIATYLLSGEIIRAVTILVVFCPCALVLATPTAIMASIANLTKCGILVKDGISIEKLAKVNKIVFDKTGTLTYGNPKVIKIISAIDDLSESNLIKLLASLESQSEHPLAKSIIKYYKENYDSSLFSISNFEMIMGKGVKAEINSNELNLLNNDNILLAGNKEFISSKIAISQDFEKNILDFLNKGATAIYISNASYFLGAVILSDVLRDDLDNLIYDLNDLDIETILMTGDNKNTAEFISEQLGLDEFAYGCLPEDKISAIRKFQKIGDKVAMVGDGINDAPALKQADVGISMGGVASDISIDASDMTLITDDINYLPHLIAISRKTLKTINIGIAFSLGLNFLAMFLAMFGILGPIEGALVHNIGSIFVIIYSSTLLKFNFNSKIRSNGKLFNKIKSAVLFKI